jgi:hypothetical protein
MAALLVRNFGPCDLSRGSGVVAPQLLEAAFTAQSYMFGAIAQGGNNTSRASIDSAGAAALRIMGGFDRRAAVLFNIASWLLLVVIITFTPSCAYFFAMRRAATEDCTGSNNKGCASRWRRSTWRTACRSQSLTSSTTRSKSADRRR